MNMQVNRKDPRRSYGNAGAYPSADARTVLPRRTAIVALVDDTAGSGVVTDVLTAGADAPAPPGCVVRHGR